MTNERRSREREGRPVFGERPAAIAAALASFGATVAFLAPAALGGSCALAEEPAVQGRAPAEVVAGFEPAIPDGRVAPAEESIDGVLVRARYVDTDGTRRIVVELKAPQGRGGEVACTVGLDGFASRVRRAPGAPGRRRSAPASRRGRRRRCSSCCPTTSARPRRRRRPRC
jgi:hypothetical protein